MIPGHINATCKQEALGLSEKWNESLKSLKGRPAQSFTPSPRQSSEASAFTWGSCSSLLSYTATRTDECALKECKGRTSLVAQWEPVCQRGGHGFDPCSGKILCATEQLSPCAPTLSPRSATRGAAAVRDPPATTAGSLPAAPEPQRSQKSTMKEEVLKKEMEGQHNSINGI